MNHSSRVHVLSFRQPFLSICHETFTQRFHFVRLHTRCVFILNWSIPKIESLKDGTLTQGISTGECVRPLEACVEDVTNKASAKDQHDNLLLLPLT